MGFVFDQVSGAVPTLAIGRLTGEVHGFWHGDGPVPEVLRGVFARQRFTLHDGRIRALDLDGKKLRAVRTDNGDVPLDVLFLHPPQEQVLLVAALGVELDRRQAVVIDKRGQTTVRGIYAAGDLATKSRQQVVHALSMGADAGISLTFDLCGPADFNALLGEHRTAPAPAVEE